MVNPIFLDAVQEGETRLAATIKHYALPMPANIQRIDAMTSYVEDLILTKGSGGQTIVFTNTKDDADRLIASDAFSSLKCQVLHGDISQGTRQLTIRKFKEGAINVLVATDVAARGLDIAGVDLVLHFGPPNSADDYVHRSGRTGRAGRNGTSIMLFSRSEGMRLSQFERALNFKYEYTARPSLKEIIESSALVALKKAEEVNDDVAEFFLPYANDIINSISAPNIESESNSEDEDNLSSEKILVVDPNYVQNQTAELIAKLLAIISNKKEIEYRFFQFFS
jgi:ATP-dependent RNA helicase DDX21